MRKRRSVEGLTVNAVAGTHVVLLGLNLAPSRRAGCLGFAIQREDHTEDERYWMTGMKTFAATDPLLGPGGQVSSREHPFQSFQWADYSAKPLHDYTYTVLPLYGKPTKLKEGASLSVRIATEPEWATSGSPHSIFFNRGAIASQEYARRFQNQSPQVVGEAAYRWLSRGLLEAFQAFVARASGASFGLHGAFYEFQWPEALATLKQAAERGVELEIVYDAIPGDTGPKDANLAAIAAAGLKPFVTPHTEGKIMHNKFLVLSRKGKPIAVWTGSTNLTENGIFGHLNVGHAVDDAMTARRYLDYFAQLKADEAVAEDKLWTAANNPAPPETWTEPLTLVFSPHKGLNVLDWYVGIADDLAAAHGANGPHQPLFMTFAFGMHDKFKAVYEQPAQTVLRFALMEKAGNGSGLAQGKKDIARIRNLPNVVVAIGDSIAINSFDRWLAERDKLTKEANVKYVHTKFMLVDPLGPKPVVITGSANFSEASTNTNGENMLVIRNDRRVADIYLGEFMRIFSHYAFRESLGFHRPVDQNPSHLSADDSWQRAGYFDPGKDRHWRRLYFSRSTA